MISAHRQTFSQPGTKAADPQGRDRPSTMPLPGQPRGAEFVKPPDIPADIPFWLKPIRVNTRDISAVLRGYLTQTEPKLARFLVSTINAQADDIKFDEIRNAVRDGDLTTERWDKWRVSYTEAVNERFDPQWRNGIVSGAEAITGDLAAAIATLPRFDENADRIGRWIDVRGGEFITNMVDQQKLATRNIIRHMVVDRGAGPRELSVVLRAVVGNTRGQSLAVVNFMNALREQKVPEPRVITRGAAYAHRLTRIRAETIARTELASAFNFGQQELIDQAIDNGDITTIVLKRFFTSLDERVCPICGPMHGVAIKHDQTFPSTHPMPGGGDTGSTLAPPLHPRCRCTLLWEIMGVEQSSLPGVDEDGNPIATDVVLQPGPPTPVAGGAA